MAIYLTGSLAYDRIMRFPGKFVDNILPDQIENLSVSFLVDKFDEKLGGNAGNIAYTLYLLGEKPVIVSAAGRDFAQYEKALQKQKLPLHALSIYEDQLTAGCYILSDLTGSQITSFHAAALLYPTQYDFPDLSPKEDIGLICPTNPNDMIRHPKIYKERGVRYIYDPSQQLPVLQADDVLESIQGCHLLIGNEYEINMIVAKVGRTRAELLELTKTGIITTLSEKGSVITHKNGTEEFIAPVPVKAMQDPTGSGDAYRAGLLKGLVDGKSLGEAARLGSVCGAYCVETLGTQEHTFTDKEFMQRYTNCFG